jgi:biotin carboxyl carrier protein
MSQRVTTRVGGRTWTFLVSRKDAGHAVAFEGSDRVAEVGGVGILKTVTIGGRRYEASVVSAARPGGGCYAPAYDVTIGGRLHAVQVAEQDQAGSGDTSVAVASGPAEIRAVMPGKVVQVLVAPGQEVQPGEGLVVVEAMKMENELTAPRPGTVVSVLARAGEAVEAGALLVTLA